jgi:CBS domain-containing membrane protein
VGFNNYKNWLRGFIPAAIPAGRRERLRACLGAGVGLLIAQWLSYLTLGDAGPWFVAPMGASAVLLFAVPSSPLAQPWSIIGGNVSAALIGIACYRHIGNPVLAVAVAEALAIGTMFALRCLHPPSGAVALTTVLGDPAIHAAGYRFALWPVGLNSGLLLLAALLYNNLGGRRYPHPVAQPANPHLTADPLPSERVGFSRADLDRALAEHEELLDVSKGDLEELFLHAEAHAYRRHFGRIRCVHLMSRDVITVRAGQSPATAWRLLSQHRFKALPVVDEEGQLCGIVSQGDFLAFAKPGNPGNTWPLRVEQMMTRNVRAARPEQAVSELVPLFSDGGFHHLPVLDAQKHVIGMVTQSDLVAALYRARLEEAA